MGSKRKRCFWAETENLLMRDYHDREWGRPVHDDRLHFEMLTLEGAQAGLSWQTILNKREGYRKAFNNFDLKKVIRYDGKKIKLLMNNPDIVRNRLKIESTVSNAKLFLDIKNEFGSFDHYIWSFVEGIPLFPKIKNKKNYPTKTSISDLISKDLKKRGFRFVGSTIIYAYMEACGITQNHTAECYLYNKKIRRLR